MSLPTTSAPATGSTRAVPFHCPFCAEEDLRPVPAGRWHCRSCLRVFSIEFHGVHSSLESDQS
jgi:ribosomal protein L37AE/L43A